MPSTLSAERVPPAALAGVTQAAASALALLPVVAGLEITLAQWALVQAAIALRIATLAGAARWWLPLHLSFVPGIVWASGLNVPALAWAGAFIVLVVVYGSSFRTQVPLFLTGQNVRARLAGLLPPGRSLRILDLGCGLGGVIAALKRARPECEVHGVELAPLPLLVSRWRAWRTGCRVERRDLMSVDLSAYDVVYAFLSPAPMPALWTKVKREMRPGSLFVSLAFPVPGTVPHEVISISGRDRHTLYIWRM